METFKRSRVGEATERKAFSVTRTERLCETTDIPVASPPVVDLEAVRRIAKELQATNNELAQVDRLVKKLRR